MKSRLVRAKSWTFLFFGDTKEEIEKMRFDVLRFRQVYLDILKIGFALSPVHVPEEKASKKKIKADKVEDVKETESKKFHCHCVLSFGSLKTWEQVDDVLENFVKADSEGRRCGVTRAFCVDNLVGILRYLVHLDDREKQQFTDEELEQCKIASTIDLMDAWERDLSPADKEQFLEQVEELILFGDVLSMPALIFRFRGSAVHRALIRRNYNFFMTLFKEVRSGGGWSRVSDKMAECVKSAEKSKKMTETNDEQKKEFNIFTDDSENSSFVSGSTSYNA